MKETDINEENGDFNRILSIGVVLFFAVFLLGFITLYPISPREVKNVDARTFNPVTELVQIYNVTYNISTIQIINNTVVTPIQTTVVREEKFAVSPPLCPPFDSVKCKILNPEVALNSSILNYKIKCEGKTQVYDCQSN